MRLLYLTLSTVFGFIGLFLAFLILFGSSIGLLITTLTFVSISVLCGYKYKKAVKMEDDFDGTDDDEIVHQREVILYKTKNHDVLLQYTRDINQILSDRYHFKTAYRPKFTKNIQYDYSNPDYVFLKKGLRPEQAARIIFDEVCHQGDNFNPGIIQGQYLNGNLPKFSGIYKAFFGSHNPSFKRVISTFSIFLVLFMVFYGLPIKFFKTGQFDNLFVPSPEWMSISTMTTWMLTLGILFVLFKNPNFQIHMRRKYKGGMRYFMCLLFAILFFFMFHLTLSLGLPKTLNQIIGTEKEIQLTVSKDLSKHTTHGKNGSFTPYCVLLTIPEIIFLKNEYCIQKERYDQLPTSRPITLKFNSISSIFGYRLIEDYEDFHTQ